MLELTTATTLDLARSAARHGAGLFETARVEAGRPLRLGLHLERLARGLAFLGMEEAPDEGALTAFLQKETAMPALPLGVLRLVAVDAALLAWAEPLVEESAGTVAVALAANFRRSSSSPLNRHKTLAYLENNLLARQARASGVYELLALNEHDRLTDGSRTTALVLLERTWITPPIEEGALPGTLRALLLQAGLVREEPVTLAVLRKARALVLANALRELVPVAELAGLEGIAGLDPEPRSLRDLRAAVAESKR
jgi:branched-chain amino acid aminotransferase